MVPPAETFHVRPARDPRPALAPALAIVRALSEAMRTIPAELPPGVPSPQAAEARLASGVPALEGEPLVSWDTLLRNALVVTHALSTTEVGRRVAGVAERLGRLVPAGPEEIPTDALAAAALAGAWEPVAVVATALRVDAEALITLLDFAARPALTAGAASLGPLFADDRWGRGRCRACGAPPTLSVVRGKEHERRLHCGRCGTAWAFPRVRCPACGERNHERLHHLHAAGEGEFRRAEVCDGCRNYVKSVSLLDQPDGARLLELDLETAALDFIALEAGYTRAGASA